MSPHGRFPPPYYTPHPNLHFPQQNLNPQQPPRMVPGGSNQHFRNWGFRDTAWVGSSFLHQPPINLVSPNYLYPPPPPPLEIDPATLPIYPPPALPSHGIVNPYSQRPSIHLAESTKSSGKVVIPPRPSGSTDFHSSQKPFIQVAPSIEPSGEVGRPPTYIPPPPSCSTRFLSQPIEFSGRIEMAEATRRSGEKRKTDIRNLKEKKMVSSQGKPDQSISGVKMSRGRAAFADPMRRSARFICKMKFWTELPDPTHQPKIMKLSNMSYDEFTKYSNASLEQQHRPELYVEPDLGIPLDLLDLNALNPPKGVRLPLDPEDEELLCDDDLVTPVEKDGLKKKQRPDAETITWLMISEHRPMPSRKKRYGSSARRNALSVMHGQEHVNNSAPQEIIMQDSGLNLSGGVEHNTTRPKRARKKPAYLADYEL